MKDNTNIWDEKNLTDRNPNLSQNEKNDNLDTTIETKNESIKPICEDIGKRKRKCWSKDEINKLRHLYEVDGLCVTELISEFPNRTEDSIHLKITRLKLRHTKIQQTAIWSRLRIGEKNPMFGKSPPTKGHTKETMASLKISSEKIKNNIADKIKNGTYHGLLLAGENNPMYGKSAWNKGLNKHINESVRIGGLKSSVTNKKRYELMNSEEKLVIKNRMAQMGSKCKKKNTFIEIRIQEFLNQLNVIYESNYIKDGFAFDIYIPKHNLIIECQGDYWHMNPVVYKDKKPDNIQKKNIARDLKKIKYLSKNNYRYLYLWEYDIRRNFELIKESIKQELCI
mgnify:CR=1 FL=1